MADAISCTAEATGQTKAIGAMLISSDAIISQGLAETFVSGVPMLIIAGALEAEQPQISSLALLRPVTKACLKATELTDIVSGIFEAYQLATAKKTGACVSRDIGSTASSRARVYRTSAPASGCSQSSRIESASDR